ncbi:MAG: L-iditol 2-dehydrogenase [Roseibium album]|uniref:L-iditol 2-dehydrogenase n=1 Tax=Roseibium album TaxID=311410 RepID=UPI000CF05B0D|nr:D-sorbitol dehydrogenase (acceptor) [Labrenzia sp. EL_142]MBG6159852.1 D-sorbitol dehydrogenase (acceptor) [Labrenzia sp. EL_162]MBG6165750.1 D-sorbitol dehydrogenase (acceptor) [Labrenzia sp. EL_195]MBG6176624.1 D-sorbitol dehydrogenase (acceptor) [Labrenzia sp. EL_132]MBG6198384.1 D-sorbitol dehydrogenase (acceptor) [Labrenzia sp. EL_159]MBG6211168.1 D-sorbitol dehydrogenase (acceptor) [Labrenzia sp. EL_126]MBG6230906.1 D-sorbitol dehydrogenase (acceptor) [Labrenzia sp. EL_208]MCR906017
MRTLEGKVALVTGGARGIGRAVCEAMADAGAKVAVADLREDDAAETAQAIGGLPVEMNVMDFDALSDSAQQVENALGGIDILVNNAGIFNMASIDRITPEDYRRQYDVNVGGTIFACQAVIPFMKKRGGGAIINFSSQAGRRGEPNITLYCSTKAAVISITQSLALELATDNIRVNAIAPGVIDTPMWDVVDAQFSQYENKPRGQKKREVGEAVPLGRMGDPRDIADPCVFLASDASRYITAQTLNVDGGNWMS